MLLYYQGDSVDWFYTGTQTYDEIKADPFHKALTEVPCVLYDNGLGEIYSFEPLETLCTRWAVPYTGNPVQDFDSLKNAMAGTYKAPGVAEAQATADEAKATAQTAAEGANPQVATFARMLLPAMAATMTDEQALSVSTLWPEWSAESVSYKADDVVQHADHLWRCEQDHTSQESWTPDAAPSLWSQIDIAGDGVDVWTQPTGAHNAYNTGDRVHYPTASDPIYVSLIDGNTWSPDAYPAGWQLEE